MNKAALVLLSVVLMAIALPTVSCTTAQRCGVEAQNRIFAPVIQVLERASEHRYAKQGTLTVYKCVITRREEISAWTVSVVHVPTVIGTDQVFVVPDEGEVWAGTLP